MNTIKVLSITLALIIICYSLVTYAANKKVERQKYKLVKSIDNIEIRFYPKAVMATVISSNYSYTGNSSNSFRTLAGYIFGGNKSSEKISMTAPVHMELDTAGNSMSFVMPSEYNMSLLPKPNDANINLHYSQEGYYAVLKFGGFANEHKIENKIKELKSAIDKLGYKTIGTYSYLGYNAPWDIIGRENEITVQIAYEK
jgi:hypothetical protein